MSQPPELDSVVRQKLKMVTLMTALRPLRMLLRLCVWCGVIRGVLRWNMLGGFYMWLVTTLLTSLLLGMVLVARCVFVSATYDMHPAYSPSNLTHLIHRALLPASGSYLTSHVTHTRRQFPFVVILVASTACVLGLNFLIQPRSSLGGFVRDEAHTHDSESSWDSSSSSPHSKEGLLARVMIEVAEGVSRLVGVVYHLMPFGKRLTLTSAYAICVSWLSTQRYFWGRQNVIKFGASPPHLQHVVNKSALVSTALKACLVCFTVCVILWGGGRLWFVRHFLSTAELFTMWVEGAIVYGSALLRFCTSTIPWLAFNLLHDSMRRLIGLARSQSSDVSQVGVDGYGEREGGETVAWKLVESAPAFVWLLFAGYTFIFLLEVHSSEIQKVMLRDLGVTPKMARLLVQPHVRPLERVLIASHFSKSSLMAPTKIPTDSYMLPSPGSSLILTPLEGYVTPVEEIIDPPPPLSISFISHLEAAHLWGSVPHSSHSNRPHSRRRGMVSRVASGTRSFAVRLVVLIVAAIEMVLKKIGAMVTFVGAGFCVSFIETVWRVIQVIVLGERCLLNGLSELEFFSSREACAAAVPVTPNGIFGEYIYAQPKKITGIPTLSIGNTGLLNMILGASQSTCGVTDAESMSLSQWGACARTNGAGGRSRYRGVAGGGDGGGLMFSASVRDVLLDPKGEIWWNYLNGAERTFAELTQGLNCLTHLISKVDTHLPLTSSTSPNLSVNETRLPPPQLNSVAPFPGAVGVGLRPGDPQVSVRGVRGVAGWQGDASGVRGVVDEGSEQLTDRRNFYHSPGGWRSGLRQRGQGDYGRESERGGWMRGARNEGVGSGAFMTPREIGGGGGDGGVSVERPATSMARFIGGGVGVVSRGGTMRRGSGDIGDQSRGVIGGKGGLSPVSAVHGGTQVNASSVIGVALPLDLRYHLREMGLALRREDNLPHSPHWLPWVKSWMSDREVNKGACLSPPANEARQFVVPARLSDVDKWLAESSGETLVQDVQDLIQPLFILATVYCQGTSSITSQTSLTLQIKLI
eukprot:GHVN01003477.1.p1 GENE.GHVN01003477.1~~GHVN01003477.1.p1  ORF type:complete len:1034 (+),score=221.40 GHVN01003477.1:56-3157(+)